MARLETLERRVYVLEHPAGASSALPVQEPSSSPVAQAGEQLSGSLTGGAFSVLGKAMLGIAGAYLLRAVAESSSLPKTGGRSGCHRVRNRVAGMGLAREGRRLAGRYDLCLHVGFDSCSDALGAYSALQGAACARDGWGGVRLRNCSLSPGMEARSCPGVVGGQCHGVAIALSLSIASHQLTPFIAVLLLMVLICEYGAGRALETGVRVLVALAADVAIWALIYIYSSPQSTRADYPLIGTATLLAPGLALFLILGVSLIYRTVLKKRRITVFETIQTMIAFLLAACSLIYFGPPASATALGIFCVVLSGASYAAAFVHFDRAAEGRNYRVFATWSAALFLAGSLLCLPTLLQAPWLSAAAVAATFAGARLRRLALELHGVVFLFAAATISGLLNHIFGDLGGTHPGAPGFGIYLVSACTVLCYAAIKPCQEESWRQQVLSIVFASLAIGAASALLVDGLLGLVALRVIPGAHHLAFIRTFTLCVAAIALAFSGPHWRRMELTRIGYATLALLAVKLVLEDLRNGHLEFIAASIFLFAITLIMVPRVARLGSKV